MVLNNSILVSDRKVDGQGVTNMNNRILGNARRLVGALRLRNSLCGLATLVLLGALPLACGSDDDDISSGSGAEGGAPNTGGADNGGAGGESGGAGIGGGGGAGGDGGGGGGTGSASGNVEFQQLRPQKVDKVDVLFMIDNSQSMGDKHLILATTMQDILGRLVYPYCLDKDTGIPVKRTSLTECPPNSEYEFDAVTDIHIGVISSSLGSLGENTCVNTITKPDRDEKAHLITRGYDMYNPGSGLITVPTYGGKGFLNWDPGQTSTPPGENSADNLFVNIFDILYGVGEFGCGYEASLEAWYRFLVDPAPYNEIALSGSDSIPVGVDTVLLQQRKDFLRNDSLLTIVMLTDENDCSLNSDNRLAHYAMKTDPGFTMSSPTNECATDPWSPDCKSCWSTDVQGRPECATSSLPAAKDGLNLRCFDQKRRFGLDFLFPVSRYVDGLTKVRLPSGQLNRVFCNDIVPGSNPEQCATLMRPTDQIYLLGIVGVPFQDIRWESQFQGNPMPLSGIRPSEQFNWRPADFAAHGENAPSWLIPLRTPGGDPASLWDVMIGRTQGGEASAHRFEPIPTEKPLDPLMVESETARTGTHPATGAALVPPNGFSDTVPNGAERVPIGDDLQYACIFKLAVPIDCTAANAPPACDCKPVSGDAPHDPLCWNGSSYATTQYYAKAYPGTRQLATLKGIGSQGVVGSVCSPPGMEIGADTMGGYRYSVKALADAATPALRDRCLGQKLAVSHEAGHQNTVQCSVLEATKSGGTCPACSGARQEATASQKAAVSADPAYIANNMNCVCEIKQIPAGSELNACVSEASPPAMTSGAWCYVDPEQQSPHNPDLVANCPFGKKQTIRFLGFDVPKAGSLTYLQCVGDSE